MDDLSGFDKTDKLGEKYEEDLVKDLIRDYEYLAGLRGNWNTHWREIAERFLPMHKNLFQDTLALQSQGDKRNQEILDSTAVLALARFGAILDSLLTPRNSYWHNLKPTDRTLLRDKNVMDWFSKVNTIMFEQRYAATANFAAQNQMHFKSLGAYGTAAMFIDQLAGKKALRYRNTHLSEIYLQENHQGNIERVCRRFVMTARQAYQKFGKKCPDVICKKVETAPEEQYFFLHWVVPRTDRDPERKDFKGMEYASYYISLEGKKLVAEGGYRTFPYSISRYEQAPQEAYGRSPAMDALPAVKTLNKQKELVLKQGQLALDPVMLVHDDGIMDGASVESGSYISGAIGADGRALVQPLTPGRIDIGEELMNAEKSLINDTFFVSLFQILIDTPEKTATEVMELAREKGILMAPTVVRQQSEYLGPLVDREVDLLSYMGALPPMPRMLLEAAGEYQIVYDSPITRTQKAEWAAGAVRTIEILTQVAQQTGDPSKLFYINWDIAAPAIADIYGTPSPWMNTPDVVQLMKQEFAKQQQQQQQIQAMPAMAAMAKAQK